MKNLAVKLSEYIIKKGMANEEERTIYEYGFQYALETGLSIFITSIIAIALHMLSEGLLFYLVFIPLRSYAGGLHLNTYWTCLSLSCLTFSIILLIVKFLELPYFIMLITILVFIIAILLLLFPVENENRSVDEEEKIYFQTRFKKILFIDIILVISFFIFECKQYLLLILVTFFMIVITMLVGKIKYYLTVSK
jgi:accessory gene regulator B